jgi:hypothetical protein
MLLRSYKVPERRLWVIPSIIRRNCAELPITSLQSSFLIRIDSYLLIRFLKPLGYVPRVVYATFIY